MRALVWFRSDLRVADNPALHAACRAADCGVVGVFVLCPRQWREHDWGHPKVDFLLRNLQALAGRLEALRIPLRILNAGTFAGVPRRLLALARAQACAALYFNREYEVNETRRDAAVRAAFEKAGRRVLECDDQVLIAPGELRTRGGEFFTVYTPFRRAWQAAVAARGFEHPLPVPRRQERAICASDPLPAAMPGFRTDAVGAGLERSWPAGERAAQRRLSDFVHYRLAEYRRWRDVPAADATSRLSPYLALGVLSPRQCFAAAAEANGVRSGSGNDGQFASGRAAGLAGARAGAATWCDELIWREFYRHVVVGFPRVSMDRAFRPETERIRWRDAPEDLAAWQAGRTGFPIVDAGMRQLAATGWMHNRLRMIVAMFLTKDLLISWRAGERLFMQRLVDGDLASNNGGWQWSASTGTDAVPYFRIFNPALQGRRCDPDGTFVRTWVPELRDVPAAALHDPDGVPEALRHKAGYPAPMCDHAGARRRALAAFAK